LKGIPNNSTDRENGEKDRKGGKKRANRKSVDGGEETGWAPRELFGEKQKRARQKRNAMGTVQGTDLERIKLTAQ